jgi:hypothetical protein
VLIEGGERCRLGFCWVRVLARLLAFSLVPVTWSLDAVNQAHPAAVAVAPQYTTTHVYVAAADLDAFVQSFVATFGGTASKRSVTNVLPVASSTAFQYVLSPVGGLSIFAYQTPVPFPFGEERTGSLVRDMNEAIGEARAAGAEVIVAPFKDPIGLDAVIQWPGGVKMQMYWHFTPPDYEALATVPDNRVYVSPDAADTFIRDFVRFSRGKVVADDKHADGGEIGAKEKVIAEYISPRRLAACWC